MFETRDVSGFSAVQMSGVGELIISQGDHESLTIEADDHILPLIETEVVGDTLTIGFKRGSIIRDVTRLVYRLTVINLEAFIHDGKGDTTIAGLNAVDGLNVLLRGAGDVTISGSARSQLVEMQGSGSYDGRDFATAQALVSIQGAGDVIVQVSDTLAVSIAGVGNVTYYGDPAITRRIAGVGSLRQGR